MKKVLIFMTAVLTLLSCGGKTGTAEPESPDQESTELHFESASMDSTEMQNYQSTSSQDGSSMPTTSRSTSCSSSSYYADEEEEEDGMRGFDPAFEDDMDDNGMSRYMDNDDEEGWD